jgi:hypothetical protein
MKTLLSLLLATASLPALADDAGLLRCRAVAEAGARLACYDALLPAAASTAPVRAPVPAPLLRDDTFGQASLAKKTEPDAIDSHIPGSFDGWVPNQRITLANGQVWKIVDDSEGFAYGDNLKVKVSKGAFGAFYLQVDGLNKMALVKRVK